MKVDWAVLHHLKNVIDLIDSDFGIRLLSIHRGGGPLKNTQYNVQIIK